MATHPKLIPMTDQAKKSISNRKYVEVTYLPFRIGRECRLATADGRPPRKERRRQDVTPNNDLHLIDSGELINISREHLQIELNHAGEYCVFDRGSTCGTHVDQYSVGGKDATGTLRLKNGSIIVIGTIQSPYQFKFEY